MKKDLFYGTRGNPAAPIMVVGESWGVDERQQEKPFVGRAGRKLMGYLRRAGIEEKDVFFTNVVAHKPDGNKMDTLFEKTQEVKKKGQKPFKGLYPKPIVASGLKRLQAQIEEVRPEFIIACGNYALWALTEDCFNISNSGGRKVPVGIANFHGSQLKTKEGIPLLPIWHPAAALRNPAWSHEIVYDLSKRYKVFKDGLWDEPYRHFIVAPTRAALQSFFRHLQYKLKTEEQVLAAVDIEEIHQQITCIGMAIRDYEAICIPYVYFNGDPYWDVEDEMYIHRKLREIFTHPKFKIIGQTFLFDAQYINRDFWITVDIHQDTMLMQHLLWPGTELGLAPISRIYCQHHRYWKEDRKDAVGTGNELEYWKYNCRDCVVTFEAAEALMEEIKNRGLEELWDRQRKQQQIILKMMLRGVKIDLDRKKRVADEIRKVRDSYIKRLEELLPEDIYPPKPKASPWYTSPSQQKEIFTQLFGLKAFFNPKKKAYTTDSAALDYYVKKEPILAELCKTLKEFRSLSTFRTFTEMTLTEDNRMRCSFTPTASTFRWKSSENAFGTGGNLQNLPKGDEE